MLPTMLTLWGIVTTLQGNLIFTSDLLADSLTCCKGVVSSYGGLLAARFFLGLLEGMSQGYDLYEAGSTRVLGGVFPGLVLYLSYFYPRQQLQWRQVPVFSVIRLM
jgi:hypothetical protein